MSDEIEKTRDEKIDDLVGMHAQLLTAGLFVSRIEFVGRVFLYIYSCLSWLCSDKGKVLRWLIIGAICLYVKEPDFFTNLLKVLSP